MTEANIGFVLINILILWINVKLYTEILKGLHFDARSKRREP